MIALAAASCCSPRLAAPAHAAHLARLVCRLQHAPAFLRLALHDALTWDAASRTGGANGSIRTEKELVHAGGRAGGWVGGWVVMWVGGYVGGWLCGWVAGWLCGCCGSPLHIVLLCTGSSCGLPAS